MRPNPVVGLLPFGSLPPPRSQVRRHLRAFVEPAPTDAGAFFMEGLVETAYDPSIMQWNGHGVH